jgi:hypothetical protein
MERGPLVTPEYVPYVSGQPNIPGRVSCFRLFEAEIWMLEGFSSASEQRESGYWVY